MILKWTGRTFIAAGALTLLFVVHQLVGTNVIAKQSQRKLEARLKQTIPSPAPIPTDPSPSAAPSPDPSPSPAPSPSPSFSPPPELGSGIAIIEVPRIGLHAVVVEGVGVRDLRLGPGHFPKTPLPGQGGNMVISGHRTTYGAPFARLNEVGKGDLIRLFTARGTFDYQVSRQRIVAPTEVSVIAPTKDARLTLTTCHPKFSAKQRLVVTATFVPATSPVPTAPAAQEVPAA